MDATPTTAVDEIADGIFRISTFLPDVTPVGFTFNQVLIRDDEPLLFHTGPRGMFPLVAEAVARVIPVASLRWISFGHVESDECGAMGTWSKAAPGAQVVHSKLACDVSLDDLCDRPPLGLDDGEVLELGEHRVRLLATPHVPHGWEAIVLHEEATGTLLCGDLFTRVGGGPALTADDPVGPALEAEAMFGATALAPSTGPTLRRLASLEPRTLALMHGPSFRGDGGQALRELAAGYEALAAAALQPA